MAKRNIYVRWIHEITIECSKCKKISSSVHELCHTKVFYSLTTSRLKKCSFCKNTRLNIILSHKHIGKKWNKVIRY